MTVAAKDPLELYDGDGVTTAFAARFRYLDVTHLLVELVSANGTPTVLTSGLHYAASAGATDAGGTVTMVTPPAAGEKLRIQRQTPRAQPTLYPTTGTFPAKSHELALDRNVMIAQEQDGRLARAPLVPVGESPPEMDIANIGAGQVLALVNGKIAGIDNDPASAADSAATALSAKDETLAAANAALAAQTGAQAAAAQGGRFYPGARDYVPQGAVIGAGTISAAGNGGTNGTFPLAYTGGNFDVNPTGTFTVAGGALTAINTDGPGLYIGNAMSKPTLSFAASVGLTGATGDFATKYLVAAGEDYLTDHASDPRQVARFRNVANAPTPIDDSVDFLNFNTLDALAAAATASANAAAAAVLQNRMRIDDSSSYIGVAPKSTWNGTAGTGFVSAPADPVRTTAKPALRLIVPPNQAFTDYLVVGVTSWANNGGALDNCGLKQVTFHYEGNTAVVTRPSIYSFQDANGKTVSYFGWWAVLLYNGTNGAARLYVEAQAKLAVLQKRVIGPYTFYPRATLNDYSVTVNSGNAVVAGVNYQTITDALIYLAGVAAQNPKITITGGGPYTMTGNVAGAGYVAPAWCTIEATTAVTIARTGYSNPEATNNQVRVKFDGLCFRGSNITIDTRYITYMRDEGTRPYWYDGCEVTNSAGRGEMWRMGQRPIAAMFPGAYFTEATITGVSFGASKATLIRGCSLSMGYNDVATDCPAVIGNRVNDWDSTADWHKDVNAFTVIYAGAEATASLSLVGSNAANTRTFTAKWGANSATFAVQTSEAAFTANTNYTIQNVVDWLNGLGVGFTATLQDNTRRACACSLPGLKGIAFTNANCKNTLLQVVTEFDVHADFVQQNSVASGGYDENAVIADNVVVGMAGQDIYFAQAGGIKDLAVINNAFFNKKQSTGYAQDGQTASQFMGPNSHVIVAHNSWATQQVNLRPADGYSADAYCLLANNVMRYINWIGAESANLAAVNNHINTGYTAPVLSTGTTIGGDDTTLFQSASTGDFTPKGALMSNMKTPMVERDFLGRRRSRTEPVGATV